MPAAIERALGGGLLAQRQRHASACAECADAGCEVVEDALRRCNGLLDVRVLSAAVAGRGMTFAAVYLPVAWVIMYLVLLTQLLETDTMMVFYDDIISLGVWAIGFCGRAKTEALTISYLHVWGFLGK